ncbi:hypothetical protein IFM89_030670 [Coptis chinensis]|uniref:Uncharacterized protein n=1 Tax=Coptis chinensis TaxID=261450 RepID=A0A835MB27_9MAGN|nr:hypothetical protein IFM89_030670 [Coptis chinensis]
MKGFDKSNIRMDREAMELLSRTRAQKEEIVLLREQIAETCIKELQLLNEKHALERKFSDLRMSVDEKQHDGITSALTELARRKGDLEENLNLAQELMAVEDEDYIFTSSMLSLLAEYGIRPNSISALAISNSAKRLYDQLQWKINTINPCVDNNMPPKSPLPNLQLLISLVGGEAGVATSSVCVATKVAEFGFVEGHQLQPPMQPVVDPEIFLRVFNIST